MDSASSSLPFRAPGTGSTAKWSTITPDPAIRIGAVVTGGLVDCDLHKDGFNASYFWGDNGVNFGAPQITIDCNGVTGDEDAAPLQQLIASSRYFGFQASCTSAAGCTVSGFDNLVVARAEINLLAVRRTLARRWLLRGPRVFLSLRRPISPT